MAEQRIQLAEAQAKAVTTQEVRSSTFLRIWSGKKCRQKGYGAVCFERSGRRYDRSVVHQGTFGLTAGWHLDIWGKNRAELLLAWVRLKHGGRNASKPAIAGWQRSPPVLGVANPGGVKTVLQQIEKEQNTIIATDRQLIRTGLLLQLKVWKPILMPANPAAAQRCRG